MKKAILITGIIWTILCFLGMILFAVFGSIYMLALQAANSDLIAQVAQQNKVSVEEARQVITVIAGVFIVAAVEMLLGFIFSIVLMAKRNSEMSKGAGIALGVVGAVLGSTLPGIFFIVDSAKSRH